jgi:hypothetical protein
MGRFDAALPNTTAVELGGVLPEDSAAELAHGPRGELVGGDRPLLPPHGAVHGEDAVAEQVGHVLVVERALAVVSEVGPEDVLHDGRVARVDLPPAGRRQQLEGLALPEQVRVVVVQPPDVVQLVEHRAYHGRVPLLRLAAPAAADQQVVRAERQQREAGGGGGQGNRRGVVVVSHGRQQAMATPDS